MTFVDSDTGMLIDCSIWEYQQLKGQFIKTKWVTDLKEEDEKISS